MKEIVDFSIFLEENSPEELKKPFYELIKRLEPYSTGKKHIFDSFIYRMNKQLALFHDLVEFVSRNKKYVVYFPLWEDISHTKEELGKAVGYLPRIKKYILQGDSKEPYQYCDECRKIIRQTGDFILPESQKIKRWNMEKRIFYLDTMMDVVFVSIPMYQYLIENNIPEECFRPVKTSRKKKLIAYQIAANNILPEGAYIDGAYIDYGLCPLCGKHKMFMDFDKYYYQEKKLDMDKITEWKDVNGTHDSYFTVPHLIFSKRLYELIIAVDPKEVFFPVYAK